MKHGFFFDIDGCLTLPQYKHSVLDKKLLQDIYELSRGHPVALVTGRSHGWLDPMYSEMEISHLRQIPTYFEFGLLHRVERSITRNHEAKNFLKLRSELIASLGELTKKEGIYFEPDQAYDDYPDHGSLWVENKEIQLSVAANTEIATEKVHNLSRQAWSEFENKVTILYHHLGVDILPKGWSKEKATEHFVETYVSEEADFYWFVFGDNVSDKLMMNGLTHKQFISTKIGGSHTVRNFLENL